MTQKNTYSRVKPCDYRCLPMRLFIFANSTIRISSFDYPYFFDGNLGEFFSIFLSLDATRLSTFFMSSAGGKFSGFIPL